MKHGEGYPRCNFRYTNSNNGEKGICVTDWYTCLWAQEWGWCVLCGWTLVVVLIAFLYCYFRDRKDTMRVKGVGSRRD